MVTIVKRALSLVLLVAIASAPLACVNVNRPAKEEPKTEVNVGGQKGVTVEHDSGN